MEPAYASCSARLVYFTCVLSDHWLVVPGQCIVATMYWFDFGLIPWRGLSLRAITGLECKWAHINSGCVPT